MTKKKIYEEKKQDKCALRDLDQEEGIAEIEIQLFVG